MEKYTQFRDKATGISPFMPLAHAPSIAETAIFGTILAIIRTLLLIPLLPLQLWSLISTVLGIHHDLSVMGVKTMLYPSKGEIYCCNSSSPLDYLVVKYLSPTGSVLIVVDGQVIQVSGFQFLCYSLGMKAQGTAQPPDIHITSPIFLFPEGTTSNGKSLLKFIPSEKQFKELSKGLKIKALCIRTPTHMTTPLPSSKINYLWRLLSSPQSTTIRAKIGFIQGDSFLEIKQSFEQMKLRSVALGISDKEQFLELYQANQLKSKRR